MKNWVHHVVETMNIKLKLLNLAYEFLLSTIELHCLPSSIEHSPDPSCLPSLSKTNSLVSLHMDPLNLCYGCIPLSNSTDKLPPMSFQFCHIITYLILSSSNCPLVPTHTSLHPALCSLCSLELLHTADVVILVRVKHLHNSIHGTHGSITPSCSFISVS